MLPLAFDVLHSHNKHSDMQSLPEPAFVLRTWTCAPMKSCCLVSQVFIESSMPVIKHYEGKGKLRKFDATSPPSEVFEKVKKLFVQTPASVL